MIPSKARAVIRTSSSSLAAPQLQDVAYLDCGHGQRLDDVGDLERGVQEFQELDVAQEVRVAECGHDVDHDQAPGDAFRPQSEQEVGGIAIVHGRIHAGATIDALDSAEAVAAAVQDVVAVVAEQAVGVGAAIHQVVARTTRQTVESLVAEQAVRPFAAMDRIVAGQAPELVVGGAAVDEIIA